jgi:hypothetical protein
MKIRTVSIRRSNLRLCTQAENSRDPKVAVQNTIGSKGVCYSKRYRNWRATIGIMNRDYSLGSYATKTEAAIAYNIGSVEFHGPFARLDDMGKVCGGRHFILEDLLPQVSQFLTENEIAKDLLF